LPDGARSQELLAVSDADQSWIIASIVSRRPEEMRSYLARDTGEIVHDRQRMLIAVLSEGNATEDSGISFVQTVAETAANSVASAKG
jgi:hypothetical protein